MSEILMKRLQPSQEASCSLVAMLPHTSRTRLLLPTSSIWAEGQRDGLRRGSAEVTRQGLALLLPLRTGRTCSGLRRACFPSGNLARCDVAWT